MQIRIYSKENYGGTMRALGWVIAPLPHGSLVPSSGVPSLSCDPFCSCVLSIILSWAKMDAGNFLEVSEK